MLRAIHDPVLRHLAFYRNHTMLSSEGDEDLDTMHCVEEENGDTSGVDTRGIKTYLHPMHTL